MGAASARYSETWRFKEMAEEPERQEPFESEGPVPNYEEALSNLTNPELLSALDLALLELEKRLYRYAHIGPEVLVMADEGLVLAARTRARLEQALSSAQHAEGHLQIVGVGGWNPTSTRPAWNTDPRLGEGEEPSS
jgi:hypothetical protein